MKTKTILAILAAGMLAPWGARAQQVDTVFATNSIYEPMGVASDATYVYVTASVSNRIVRYNTGTATLDILAGSSTGQRGFVNSPNGSLARFSSPQGLIAARGGLVVSDSGNHALRLISFNGAVTTLAGTGFVGSSDGAAAGATFNNPVGLSVDTNGNIYIADAGNGAIRILFPNDTVGTLATGFYQPHAVAVGDNGEIWVADTRNHAIMLIRTTGSGLGVVMSGTPILAAGNATGTAGGVDAENSLEALFNGPRGLLWSGKSGLLVSDTGNQVIRKVVTNTISGGYATLLVSGAYGQGGFVNGLPANARFRSPVGLCKDSTTEGFLIVDRENTAIRRLQSSAPQPPIRAPRVGYIRLVDAGAGLVALLTPVTVVTLNNDDVLGVDAEAGTTTYFTVGPTPADPLDTSSIPEPGPGSGSTPPAFVNGQVFLPDTMVGPAPNFIVKVRSSAQGRAASPVVQAQFIFKVAAPTILGDNAASLQIKDITDNARIFYTTNGVDPVDGIGAQNFGPVASGATISIVMGTNNVNLKVRAFRDNYQPSEVASKTLNPTSYSANKITFGFETGEGSSVFVAAPGQRFIAPVTLSLLPDQKMYTLQFNMSVTNNNPVDPAVSGSSLGFSSMLLRKLGEAYYVMPPLFFSGTVSNFVDFQATNNPNNWLMVGWLESFGTTTNLYNTKEQHLVQYSQAHNTLFLSSGGDVVVGGFSMTIPPTATAASVYEIKLGRPSATQDGVQKDVFIDTPTNGAIRAVKQITIGQREYVVGDCMPFGWFNAGDFGDSNILSTDLLQVFQSVIYGLNTPIRGSDFYDAMDSCCIDVNGVNQSGNALFVSSNGVDTITDTLAWGDGVLGVNDLWVSFRRSLDPSRTWYTRYWPVGSAAPAGSPDGRAYRVVNNQFRGSPDRLAVRYTMDAGAGQPFIRVTAGDVTPTPGQEIEIPITAAISGGLPLRIFWLGLAVEALDDSPAITDQVRFVPNASLGTPSVPPSRGPSTFAGVWLDLSKGLEASGELGKLVVKIPATATALSAYKINIRSFSGSPNGLGLFPYEADNGLVTLSDRSASSLGDGIPDSWRLRHFNTVNNQLSHALADADGDGVPNWMEFKAGTNPNDPASRLKLQTGRQADRTVVLRWPTASNKRYVIEVSDDLNATDWTPVATDVSGDGLIKEFKDLEPGGTLRFYRVRVQE